MKENLTSIFHFIYERIAQKKKMKGTFCLLFYCHSTTHVQNVEYVKLTLFAKLIQSVEGMVLELN